MRKLKKADYNRIYSKLVRRAHSNFSRKNYDECLKYIRYAAECMYAINNIYADGALENLLKSVGDIHFKQQQVQPIKGRFVILDTKGSDNRGLTQQYLRAMMRNSYEFRLITLRSDVDAFSNTIKEIRDYGDKGDFEYIAGSNLTNLEITRKVIDLIATFRPEAVFLHLMPYDCISLMAINALKGIDYFNINLTDHAFWMGSGYIDYNIEMRPYGKTVSVEKRGLKEEQEIEMPFYPIIDKNPVPFAGFPEMPEDAVVVFTGGAPYKMMGENDFFFKNIINDILNISEKVYVLVAGFWPDSLEFKEKLKFIDAKDRIFNIGIRRDIQEVFAHCDIYLGTYPLMGGLMSQYAAYFSKPIVCLLPKGPSEFSRVESFVNHFDNGVHTFERYDDCIDYAKRLVLDPEYRKQCGDKLVNSIMTEEIFAVRFERMIRDRKLSMGFKEVGIDYDGVSDLYVEVENTSHLMLKSLVNRLKLDVIGVLTGYWDVVAAIFFQLALDKARLMLNNR